MERAEVVVVGGSAAGLTAAITARRHYPDKRTLLVRKEKQVLIPCGIPYIFGTVGSPEKNLIPDAVLEKHGIELLVADVREIDRTNRRIRTAEGEQIGYERLVVATGSLPIMPPIPGFDKENVFTILKDVSHLRQLQETLKQVHKLLVLGGGFIGVEFADECNKLPDKEVTIVEMLPHCLLLAYDEEFCTVAERLLEERGIRVLTSSKVECFEGDVAARSAKLSGGEQVETDAVIMGIGVTANVELARQAELRLGPTGGVAVDRTMRTDDESIFACGDCAEKVSFFDGKPSPLKLASIATQEARIAGANLFETRRQNIGTVGVWSTAVGDTAFATAGLTEALAEGHGFRWVTGVAEAPNRHPGGMPGMKNMKVKLVFEKHTGVLLGGQVLGDEAAGEVINMVSACVQRRMTAEDIATFQTGTHPALTASPIAYQFVNAAETAAGAMR